MSLRTVRICTKEYKRYQRLEELKEIFLDRNYSPALVDRAIDKAKKVPRYKAFRKVKRNQENKRPVFAFKYDPRMPSVTNTQAKH